ncbi:molybdopterin oxidoreductase Fe4S4 region, partial [Desulfovibrio sp. X2]|uniref:twin-arginine translocation signal domain-containing protein n=1 Tax=Desulfovibrio sp. X2 TaxID=941449 RepID=UPI000358B99B
MSRTNKQAVERALASPLSRRSFLGGLLAAGALATLPGSLLRPLSAEAEQVWEGGYQTFRNACPRNCYDTCSIVSYVKDGAVRFVEGADESTFTRGGLCVKGNSYVGRAYSPDRIKYP